MFDVKFSHQGILVMQECGLGPRLHCAAVLRYLIINLPWGGEVYDNTPSLIFLWHYACDNILIS